MTRHACGLVACVLLTTPVVAQEDADCLACHGERELEGASGRSLFVDAERLSRGVHDGFACTDCHSGIKELPHAASLPRVGCAACHEGTVAEYARSVHGAARAGGMRDAASCQSCHGSVHEIVAGTDPASKVAKRNLADTCGACHANPDFLERHKIPFARPVEAYRLSVHGRAVERGESRAASCSDCHGSHDILPGRNARSRIGRSNVIDTCGACHTKIKEVFLRSVHGAASAQGILDSPVCTDCHGEHTILAPNEPGSLVNPARVSSVTCGRCHADERLAARFNLPKDMVPTYEDSFHGLASRAGSQTVASCASCHGIHNILPSSDPHSTVHPDNISRTCGACHPGAGTRFAIGPVHVTQAGHAEHVAVRLIRQGYVFFFIPVFVGVMALHNALDFLAKLVRGARRHAAADDGEVERMGLHFRIAHLLVVVSFPTLVVTGFALTYPDAWWAQPLAPVRGLVHRMAAVLLIVAMAYHAFHLLVSRRDRAILQHLWPTPKDMRDAWDLMRHNIGLRARYPTFGKFSYAEKAEYWAFIWGSIVMTISGFILWFNDWSLAFLPKWVSDAATAIHFYEAVLAALSILVWHFYMVVFDPEVYPMDRSWITGRASEEHLRRTRPAYLQRLLKRDQPRNPSGKDRTGS